MGIQRDGKGDGKSGMDSFLDIHTGDDTHVNGGNNNRQK